MSPRLHSPITRRALHALAAVATSAGLALAAAPAHAASLSYTGSDPKGDNVGPAGLDFVGATASYDKSAGTFTVTAETAAPMAAANGAFAVFFGTTTDGVCLYDPNQTTAVKPAFTFAYAAFEGAPPPVSVYTGRAEDEYPAQIADIKTVGNKVTLSSKPDPTLVDLPLDCLYLYGAYADAKNEAVLADILTGPLAESAAPATPPKPGTTPPATSTPATEALRAPLKVVTVDPDTDRDGTPDSLTSARPSRRCPRTAARR